MPITQTVYFDAEVPVRGEDPIAFTNKANAAWVEMKNVINNELNPAFTQMNALETNVNSKEASAATSATNAATSATTATAKANLATSVVIPTTATYSYTQQDWRQSMMSKAEFNAMAAERRANRAGSGFDEFGKHHSAVASYPNVNDGIWTLPTAVNSFKLGRDGTSEVGTSKTSNPYVSINGVASRLQYSNSAYQENVLLLPPAPTVLPYDATLTQQQIDSGVIKHADASNSGLIVNGKFDTDTSGWVGNLGGVLSLVSNKIRVTATTTDANPRAVQPIATVVGKSYTIEVEQYKGTQTSTMISASNSSTGASPYATLVSTSDGRVTLNFTATGVTTYIAIYSIGSVIGNYSEFDNIAVFPADSISRSDLVFLESWHEDVSEKDFAYPLGNVQYLGTTGDCGTTVAGAFAGSATYSLFSDTWQADSALVGKGYVWSTLSDANKKAFVANPENNCYLDGDKVIQVRYRMRVVMGWGDAWSSTSTFSYDPQVGTYLSYGTTVQYIKPKGKLVNVTSDTGAGFGGENGVFEGVPFSSITSIKGSTSGAFIAVATSGVASTGASYEGKCFALPIALVHRRNQGGYNLTYNPYGPKTMTMTPTSISDCFNHANYTAATGYIGTSTSRPDGLFYDQVSVEDFKPANKGADLRNSSKKRTAQNIIEEFAPKVIAGTIPYFNNDTTALTTYKDAMEVRDTSGNRYPLLSKVGNVATIGVAVTNKKGFTVVTQNGKQYLQVADDAASGATVQMNLSTIKYDIGVFDA